MKKLGRNEPCHCGSGKKFKKCCESKMIGGRFLASPIGASLQGRVSQLGALFQTHVVEPLEAKKEVPLESKGDILISS